MGKTPLYVEDWFSHKHLSKLEKTIVDGHCCAFNSVQSSIQAILELLGTRVDPIPVVLPITAGPDTLAAVLRAGAHPYLLDIDPDWLQINIEQLKDVITFFEDEGRVPIVILNRPFGQPIRPEILELVEDLPTILDARLLPHPDLRSEDTSCAFNVFDLTPICGTGGVVIHAFPHQVQVLKAIRSGPMGLAAALPESEAKHAAAVLREFKTEMRIYKQVAGEFAKYLPNFGPWSNWPTPMGIWVPNARKAVAHLASYDIEAEVGLFPLYKLEEVSRRYTEAPDYPVAEELENKLIRIPTHQNVQGKENTIIKAVKEIL